jgi:Domain of unknown function (DUF4136)
MTLGSPSAYIRKPTEGMRANEVKSAMKKWFLLIPLVVLAVAVGYASAQGATTSFDKDANFLNYKTYKWVNIPSAQQLDELTSDQLIGTLEVALANKGLAKSKSDTADLFIGYQIARGGGDKQLNHYAVGLSSGSAAGATSGTAGATTTVVHSGQLVLDMYDAATKKLIWRGIVSHAIDANAKPDKKQKHMDKAVEKLLRDYPPDKKS